jgi:hypothetical protein
MTMIIDGTNGGFFPSWTTATRPASPAVGQMGYNTTTGLFDMYTASGWVSSLTNASQSIPKASLPTGSVLQVVQAYKTDVFSTTTNTAFVDITGLSVSITPTSASSKILVMATLTDCSTSASSGDGMFQVLRGSTAIGNGDSGGTAPVMGYVNTYLAASVNITDAVVFNYLDSPATTSSTTYKVQCRLWSNSGSGLDGTLYVGRRNGNGSFISPSSITLLEIAA